MTRASFWSLALKSFNVLLARGIAVIAVEPHYFFGCSS